MCTTVAAHSPCKDCKSYHLTLVRLRPLRRAAPVHLLVLAFQEGEAGGSAFTLEAPMKSFTVLQNTSHVV